MIEGIIVPGCVIKTAWHHLGSSNFSEQLQYRLRRRFGRGGVLTGDQVAVADDMRLPVSAIGMLPASVAQLVLSQERYNFSQADRSLFGV